MTLGCTRGLAERQTRAFPSPPAAGFVPVPAGHAAGASRGLRQGHEGLSPPAGAARLTVLGQGHSGGVLLRDNPPAPLEVPVRDIN